MPETFYRAVLMVVEAPREGQVLLMVPAMGGGTAISLPLDSVPADLRDGLVPEAMLIGSVTLNAAPDRVAIKDLVFAPPVSPDTLRLF